MIVCSVVTSADIPKAKVMATSVKDHLPESKVVICLVEKFMDPAAEGFKHFDKVLLANELGFQWPKFDRIIFKYNVIEGVSAIKGQLLKDLLYIYTEEDYFLYLDSEMKVVNKCPEMFEELKNHSVLLTPHQLYPSKDIEREHQLLNEGTFHSGFIAIKRTENSTKFIEWFADRLNQFYEDPYKSQELDKKFLNLAMGGFDIRVLKHPGYNVAAWNLHERMMVTDKDGATHVLGQPLRIINYSNLESWRQDGEIQGYGSDKNNWSYNFYQSGERISREVRFKYRINPEAYDSYEDLFAESNSSLLQINNK
ncbi:MULTISPECIES: hypothetical protein [Bacillus]|uniref:Nucleotide-diphospho-sugar transferase domain-containing protein n=2 Tax=Bacillus TaxID=1386 RepID=A0A0M4FU39_9BACI|nr:MULTISPECIES: hypothetical protein [Bacillus]ALC83673.1 hypothetical protein AM592_20715 [Bacillus gobiensis]MBP1082704.1 hypothetical protein [Bacillus capparidis]MED1097075.1 hypothetical protein [Bacillus capparidis]